MGRFLICVVFALTSAFRAFASPAPADHGSRDGKRLSLDSSTGAPLNRSDAAHLLRRAGFSGVQKELDHLVGLGREAAVDSLLFFEEVTDPTDAVPFPPEETLALEKRLAEAAPEDRAAILRLQLKVDRRHMLLLRSWWIRRMIESPRPLQEKMTLFWHGHFTSGYREVKSSRLLYEQNRFLREHAVATFKSLLRGISRDGAMLRYLDNASNVKSSPNENYARELMELFTVGEGNYSEADIREAARAFTGWGVDLEGFRFDKRNHDSTSKTIFGARGRFGGDHVISLLLRHPQASPYMATRLWEFFVYKNPEPAIVSGLARVLRESRFNIRLALRTIFLSDTFYSDRARLAQIKSPIEVAVGAVRLLELDDYQAAGIYEACREMGQDLFQPPNVKGWDGHEAWITPNTLIARYNFGERLLGIGAADPTARGRQYGGKNRRRPPLVERRFDPIPILRKYRLTSAASIVRHFVNRLLQRDLPPDRFEVLLETLTSERLTPRPTSSRQPTGDQAQRIRNVIFLILSTPEFQLN